MCLIEVTELTSAPSVLLLQLHELCAQLVELRSRLRIRFFGAAQHGSVCFTAAHLHQHLHLRSQLLSLFDGVFVVCLQCRVLDLPIQKNMRDV